MKISEALIKGCKSKEGVAQKQLYTLLLPYLNVICTRYLNYPEERKDTLQEAFINIFQSIDKYDSTRSQFKTWAVKITINCCFKCNSKQAKIETTAFVLEKHSQSISPEVLDKFSDEDLQLFLKTMPVDFYEIFSLHVIDGFSHKEIAKILNIDEGLSRKRLSRARKWLSNKSDVVEMMAFGVNDLIKLN